MRIISSTIFASCILLVVAITLFQGRERDFYETMVTFHQRIDKNTLDESYLFIGDSHIQGLAVSSIIKNSVNFGIGLDTTKGVLNRVLLYESIKTSKAVILAIGFNDIKQDSIGDAALNMQLILESIPLHVIVIICAIPPVGVALHSEYNAHINELNDVFKALSNKRKGSLFINPFESHLTTEGALINRFIGIDSIHLSKEGYKIWIQALKSILEEIDE